MPTLPRIANLNCDIYHLSQFLANEAILTKLKEKLVKSKFQLLREMSRYSLFTQEQERGRPVVFNRKYKICKPCEKKTKAEIYTRLSRTLT
jgi:hypothetical protein